jgi:hypothetical protein
MRTLPPAGATLGPDPWLNGLTERDRRIVAAVDWPARSLGGQANVGWNALSEKWLRTGYSRLYEIDSCLLTRSSR